MYNLDEQLGWKETENSNSLSYQNTDERPTFLTVLCILSFIGNGLGLFQGGLGILMAGIYKRLFASLDKMDDSTSITDTFDYIHVFDALSWYSILYIVASLLCLFGAILMWKMKRSGFIIYLIGQVIPILAIITFSITIVTGQFQGFFIFMATITVLFPIAFCILFGINYKYLK